MGFEVITIKGFASNAYLLVGEKKMLVDTLYSGNFRKIESVLDDKNCKLEDIDYIFITHYHQDHTGNLAKLKEISGAEVIAGKADAPIIEGKEDPPPFADLSLPGRIISRVPDPILKKYSSFKHVGVDRPVSDGDMIEDLGLEIIALPGHTRGGVGLYDKTGRRAFIGDIVSCYFGRLGMPVLAASYSLQEIISSQVRLVQLDLDAAYPGHGKIISPNASEKIGEMVKEKRLKYFQDIRSRV
ncbi:MAG: MBL fold metallo-hydrolase [Actinobacteria bacterium]|nr:MBL fold metallo-hydrolase [Actinomycetota bacterium]